MSVIPQIGKDKFSELIHISSRFLEPIDSSVHEKNQRPGTNKVIASFNKCNLAFKVNVPDENLLREQLLFLAKDSSYGVSINFLDYANVVSILDAFRDVHLNTGKHVLSPLAKILHELIMSNADNYINVKDSMPLYPPLLNFLNLVSVYGVIDTKAKYESDSYSNMARYWCHVITFNP